MPRAVIFDWYGTLAEWEQPGVATYAAVLSGFGYEVPERVFDDYHARWDGVDHRSHSTSREVYAAWTRLCLRELVEACGVAEVDLERVVDCLLEADEVSTMRCYPETVTTLTALRAAGMRIGICSNWGWDLDRFLEATGVAALVDVAITSARVGFRKPHPAIYDLTLDALCTEADETVFVGDSWEPDVVGPSAKGMTAVHVLRDRRRPAPALPPRSRRIGALDELLSLATLGPGSPALNRPRRQSGA